MGFVKRFTVGAIYAYNPRYPFYYFWFSSYWNIDEDISISFHGHEINYLNLRSREFYGTDSKPMVSHIERICFYYKNRLI